MTVVYYMQVSFLDISIELINVLKKHVQLHVLIELTPHGKNLTVLEIEKFPERKTLVTPEEILTKRCYENLKPYFNGTASVHFVMHPHRTGFSYSTLQASFDTWKYIKQFKPDILHFETFGLRTVGMLFYLKAFRNVCITIHDPVPHTGEDSWKVTLPRTFMFGMPGKKKYMFYSQFAKQQFEEHYKKQKQHKTVLQMSPYSFLKNLVKSKDQVQKKYILFFGRLSPYKGIDDLLNAMPAVFREFPNEHLVIAGKTVHGFDIDGEVTSKYRDNITILDKHIPNEELAMLIQEAKFIVCPYKDATQSGVLMTAFGLNTPVIATNVGSFPEFIRENVNGLLVPPNNPEKLAEGICFALRNDHYKVLAQNINSTQAEEMWEGNTEILLKAYAS
ncbi:glycosyl transferase family 1 [Niastella yeongjuensis]|uniref:Glycosyl transferase family 1 n=1 Tax=Niastella yeongjuensis TaxID=354355 RepID=A0A1V9FCD1_9BACT|nr:glycosyltransferase family 4 protein [Niastella yeongjuensis]OQP56025.1 glycosyl transferase family 1 [Niastella yeongjuensis]SEP24830.1 Glycosyltransferase involved in cell wall bisynthesis [Niastella yeongjuensis]